MKGEIKNLLKIYSTALSEIIDIPTDNIQFQISHFQLPFQPIDTYNLPTRPDDRWSMGDYKIVCSDGKVISTFRIYQMPHCCAFAISCDVKVYHPFTSKGVGKLLNQFRQDLCKLMNYSALLCTDVDHNGAQRKVLKVNGWDDIYSVINKKTDNVVHISVIGL